MVLLSKARTSPGAMPPLVPFAAVRLCRWPKLTLIALGAQKGTHLSYTRYEPHTLRVGPPVLVYIERGSSSVVPVALGAPKSQTSPYRAMINPRGVVDKQHGASALAVLERGPSLLETGGRVTCR